MLEAIWMTAIAILLVAVIFWLWSVRQSERGQSRPDEKNPIDIES